MLCGLGESITLLLSQDQHSLCFDQPVLLICQHPLLPSGMFSSIRPSWKEDGTVFTLDGVMFRSVKRINETEHVFELVPMRNHFEPSGAHNYTCFLPLAGGGVLESNPVQISPISKLLSFLPLNCHRLLCNPCCNLLLCKLILYGL